MTNATRMRLFTKSAFKQALHCPASLYYYYDREHYANQMSEDDFLQALADGGNQVGDLAKVYYGVQPDADIDTLDGEKALEWTAGLLKQDEVNIAEAAFRWKDCFVRADIIEKKGRVINLIEVKAKSWDPSRDVFLKGGSVPSGILEYVYDVAFQKYVIQNALGPGYRVVAHLMLADKGTVADYNGINQLFHVVRTPDGRSAVVRQPGAEQLRSRTHVLTAFDVDGVAERVIEGSTGEQAAVMGMPFRDFVEEMSRRYVRHERHFSPVSSNCFGCPFYSDAKTPGLLDGRRECWKEVAGFTDDDFGRPSVGELWCGLLGARSLKKELVEAGKYFLSDLGADDIPDSRPSGGGLKPSERRLLQIALATGNDAMLAPFRHNMHDGVYLDVEGLSAEMATWRYPLHMIDFETTSVALPLYEGMHPYEQVAFQFSHHVIRRDGTIEHAGQYLNTVPLHNPNADFVRELRRQLETDGGTVFRYATHENTILRALHDQLASGSEPDRDELMAFIDSITHYDIFGGAATLILHQGGPPRHPQLQRRNPPQVRRAHLRERHPQPQLHPRDGQGLDQLRPGRAGGEPLQAPRLDSVLPRGHRGGAGALRLRQPVRRRDRRQRRRGPGGVHPPAVGVPRRGEGPGRGPAPLLRARHHVHGLHLGVLPRDDGDVSGKNFAPPRYPL